MPLKKWMLNKAFFDEMSHKKDHEAITTESAVSSRPCHSAVPCPWPPRTYPFTT
jgi:hypothetical protein